MPITAIVTAEITGNTCAKSRYVPLNVFVKDFSLGFALTVQASAGDSTVSVAV